jgi:hypothetical protein
VIAPLSSKYGLPSEGGIPAVVFLTMLVFFLLFEKKWTLAAIFQFKAASNYWLKLDARWALMVFKRPIGCVSTSYAGSVFNTDIS